MVKLEVAKDLYGKALTKKSRKEAEEKVAAYNAWRNTEEQKGRAQDEHGRGLVKVMLENVKSATPRNPVTESMCHVMGNVDCKLNICFT